MYYLHDFNEYLTDEIQKSILPNLTKHNNIKLKSQIKKVHK